MDLDLAKVVLAFLTALIFFASAILSFVNARLNEAKTPEGRSNAVNVVNVMLLLLSLGCTAAATAAVCAIERSGARIVLKKALGP